MKQCSDSAGEAWSPWRRFEDEMIKKSPIRRMAKRLCLSSEDMTLVEAAVRDEYREMAQRIQADFENYKKRILKQQTEHLERAAEVLVDKLLPVLDTFDLALAHGEGLDQVHGALLDVLAKEGLERIDPVGQAFDVARLGEPPLTGLRREMDAVRRDGAVDARRSRGLDPVVEAYPAVRKDDRAWIRQALIRR